METPKPIRLQFKKGQKTESPNGLPVVFCARPSVWGNPFRMKKESDREQVIADYKKFIEGHEVLKRKAKLELKGKNLSCYCEVGKACHCDILLQISSE